MLLIIINYKRSATAVEKIQSGMRFRVVQGKVVCISNKE
jgi:hypothetical protein